MKDGLMMVGFTPTLFVVPEPVVCVWRGVEQEVGEAVKDYSCGHVFSMAPWISSPNRVMPVSFFVNLSTV